MDEMKQTRNASQEEADMIQEYKDKVEKIRDDSFAAILANIHCPSTIPHVKSMQDFKHMYENHKQKLKTNSMKRFSELQSSPESLKEGDQLWVYHKRTLMRSYAHVVIIGQHEKFIHVAAPDLTLMIRSRARICEGDFGNLLRDDDLCFVVRPQMESVDQNAIFRERAEACLGIRLDYDAKDCNCETFANAVHGEWGPGLQVGEAFEQIFDLHFSNCHLQAPTGVAQQGIKVITKAANLTKRKEPLGPLADQMWQRIKDNGLILRFEQGPPHLI